MTQPETQLNAPAAEQGTLYCYRHPDRETLIRCGRCDRPICLQCQVRHPVGVRCRDCAQIRKDPLTTLTPAQFGLAFVSALGASTVGGFIAPYLGILFAIFVGPVIGGFIAEFVGRVIGYKRGLPLQVLVAVCIVLGVFIAQFLRYLVLGWPACSLITFEGLIALGAGALLGSIVYIICAIGGAISRLR